MKPVLYICLAVVIGAAGGYYLAPTKTVETTVVQQEKQKNNDIVTVITEKTLPDGSVEKKTEIVDKSTSSSQKATESSKTVEKQGGNTLMLRALFAGDVRSGTLSYGAGVDVKALGPIWIGLWGMTSGTIGGSLSLSF